MTSWRRRMRRARSILLAMLAFAVIGVALVIGLCQLLLPFLVRNPDQVSGFLTQRLGRPVSIERVEARWEAGGPLLSLHGVHIGAGDAAQQAFAIPQAELAISFYSWLQRNRSWNEFRVVGLDLALMRAGADEAWQLQGLGGGTTTGDSGGQNPLFDLGSLVLKNLRLHIQDGERQLTLGSDEVRLVNSGRNHRVLGRVQCLETHSPPVTVIAEYDDSDRSAELYLGAEQLDLSSVLREFDLSGLTLAQGDGNARVWAWWKAGSLDSARVELDMNHLVLGTAHPIDLTSSEVVAPRVGFDHLALAARWQRNAEGWQFDLSDFSYVRGDEVSQPVALHFDKSEQAEATVRYGVRAQAIDLAAVGSVLMLSDSLPPELRQWVYAANPQGYVRDLALDFVSEENFDISGRLDAVAWQPADGKPGVHGLSAAVFGDQAAVAIRLPRNEPFGLAWPHVFRKSLEFSEFSGSVVAYPADAAWRIETAGLSFEGEGYGGEVRGAADVESGGGRPALDLAALLTHGEVAAAGQFWAVNVMPPAVVAWLDRALVSGKFVNARAVFHGDADDWPFRNALGRFEAHGEIEDMVLNYHPEWPHAEHLRLSTTFVNDSMSVNIGSGEVAGNQVHAASAELPDLGEGQLDIRVDGSGSGKTLLEFLKASPVGRNYAAQLLGVSVGGRGQLGFRMHLPAKQIEQMSLDGSVALVDADLRAAQWNLRLDKANGKIRFGKAGFAADDLAVQLDGQPAKFKLLVGGFTENNAHSAEARLNGNFPAKAIFAGLPALDPYWPHIPGSAEWTAKLEVEPAADDRRESAKTLTLSSDLRGIAVNLPQPLAKPSEQALPMELRLDLASQDSLLNLRLGDLLRLRARLEGPSRPFAAHVAFGAKAAEVLPPAGVLVSGEMPAFDASGWMDLAQARAGGGDSIIDAVDVKAHELQLFGRRFRDTGFNFKPSKDEFTITLKGDNVDGTLRLPRSNLEQRGVTVQLDRLHFLDEDNDGKEAGDAVGVNPAAIPPLHVSIDDLRLGQGRFGAARLESTPSAAGMHIESFETHSPNVDMSARGDWSGRGSGERSRFIIDFSAENLGHMLDALGYAGMVDGGQTVAHMDAAWDGAPATFALAKLDGTLKVNVAQGRILDVNPGAGRLFGLLSLTEIPRRLSLDFSDLYRSGMSFNSISGEFSLNSGNAYTEDLIVKSPAADISVRGRTGLKIKDYDQEMEVVPHLGSTLPMVGAIAGGPIGAAAGLVLQGVFRNQIKQVARARYRVEGSWETPVITLISSESAKTRQK